MEETYKISLSETYEILNIMPTSIINKIPNQIKEIIENERAKDYNVDIKLPLRYEDFHEETIVFLGILYRDFICGEEEKEKLQKRDEELIRQYDEALKEKYAPDKVFANSNNLKEETNTEEKALRLEKESFFKRVFMKIISIFKKE